MQSSLSLNPLQQLADCGRRIDWSRRRNALLRAVAIDFGPVTTEADILSPSGNSV